MSIYLDNNATTQLSPVVKRRMHEVIDLDPGNPESPHSGGNLARSIVESCRMRIADSLNAQDNQIIFTGSGSESNSFIINDLERRKPQFGSFRVLTSQLEHSSLRSGFQLLERWGVEIVDIPVTPAGIVDLDELHNQAQAGANAFVFQWANGITGVIQPMQEISKLAQSAKATLHVDASQAYGRIPIDVDMIRFDTLSFTAHKNHGPKGVAALYLRSPRKYQASVYGGQQERYLRGGTHNIIGIAGFDAAVEDRFKDLQAATGYLQELRDQFESSLTDNVPEAFIQGADSERIPNTSCVTFPGIDGIAYMAALDATGVQCSQSSACRSEKPEPSPVLLAMGLTEDEAYASIRFSVSTLNIPEEITEAVEIVSSVYRQHLEKKRNTA